MHGGAIVRVVDTAVHMHLFTFSLGTTSQVTKLVLADSVETRILAIQAKEASGGDTAGSGSGSSSSAKSG